MRIRFVAQPALLVGEHNDQPNAIMDFAKGSRCNGRHGYECNAVSPQQTNRFSKTFDTSNDRLKHGAGDIWGYIGDNFLAKLSLITQ
jgi:hypothetical protein